MLNVGVSFFLYTFWALRFGQLPKVLADQARWLLVEVNPIRQGSSELTCCADRGHSEDSPLRRAVEVNPYFLLVDAPDGALRQAFQALTSLYEAEPGLGVGRIRDAIM